MNDLRVNVISTLHVLCSKDAQFDVYRSVDPGTEVDVAQHLWHRWCQEAYLPHAEGFVAGFSPDERDRLHSFTNFFESRLSRFPSVFEKLMVDIYWLSVIEYARALLDELRESDVAANSAC